MTTANAEIRELTSREYKYGFVTGLETDAAPRGLSEDILAWHTLRSALEATGGRVSTE